MVTIFQSKLADVFQNIMLVNETLSQNTDENSQQRYDLTRCASQYLVSYFYHKSRHVVKLSSINPFLVIFETQLCQALGSKLAISNESLKIIPNAVGEIQKLLLQVLPPESDDWKLLVKLFPVLKNYRPD